MAEVVLAVRAIYLQDELPSIETRTTPRRESVVPKQLPTTATERHVNQEAGYTFGYPEGWDIDVDDTLSTLRSPDERIVMLAGVGSTGSINDASAEFMASLRKIYSRARIERQERIDFGRTPTVLVSGNLVNATGKNIRFISATIRGDPRNFQVAAYFDPRENEKTIERLITDILESFRARTSV